MASELIVQTIKGPTSGANANKVIIPSGQTLDASAGTVSGVNQITEYDTWLMTSSQSVSGASTVISAAMSRSDATGFEKIGTGMSQSSGVFTFPSTGYWEVIFHGEVYRSGSDRTPFGRIEVTTNNSSYSNGATWQAFVNQNGLSSNIHNNGHAEQFVKVTDTANVKVRFVLGTGGDSVTLQGSSGTPITYFTFKKVADV